MRDCFFLFEGSFLSIYRISDVNSYGQNKIFDTKKKHSKIILFNNFSIEEDFVTWREKFWPGVAEHFGIEATGEEIRLYTVLEFNVVQNIRYIEKNPSDQPSKIFTELISIC